MSILDYFISGAWIKKAPADEGTGAYTFSDKVSEDYWNTQTLWPEKRATPTTMTQNELAPVTAEEMEYTAAIHKPYFNFTVTCMAGFLDDTASTLDRMTRWAIYDVAKKNTHDRWRYRISCALSWLGFADCDDMKIRSIYEQSGEIYAAYKGARTGVSATTYWNWRGTGIDKYAECEKVVILAWLAAKSIVGNRRYVKTTSLMLFARMNGQNDTYQDEDDMRANCHPAIAEWHTRKKMGRLRQMLYDEYRVATYTAKNIRGMYISTKMTPARLALEVERHRRSGRSYAQKMRDARSAALATIESERLQE